MVDYNNDGTVDDTDKLIFSAAGNYLNGSCVRSSISNFLKSYKPGRSGSFGDCAAPDDSPGSRKISGAARSLALRSAPARHPWGIANVPLLPTNPPRAHTSPIGINLMLVRAFNPTDFHD